MWEYYKQIVNMWEYNKPIEHKKEEHYSMYSIKT